MEYLQRNVETFEEILKDLQFMGPCLGIILMDGSKIGVFEDWIKERDFEGIDKNIVLVTDQVVFASISQNEVKAFLLGCHYISMDSDRGAKYIFGKSLAKYRESAKGE
jgi:hypothetical protein